MYLDSARTTIRDYKPTNVRQAPPCIVYRNQLETSRCTDDFHVSLHVLLAMGGCNGATHISKMLVPVLPALPSKGIYP